MIPTKDEISEFQKVLWKERWKRGISQAELANAIGISQGHLSYIEHGKRELSMRRYLQIVDYFNTHNDDTLPF